MDKAKQAVSGFLSRDGKHDTTVHETVNPAVTNERVVRTQHENATKVVDREVHQDHFHTTVQPIQDKQVLPEEHKHNMAAVEERKFKHGDDHHIRERLAAEQAQFKSTREVGDVQTSQSAGRDVVGEHIHHHVHENIQPVIQKETIQPSVVHTTIPVHEVHENEAKHHTASALPAMTMEDFKRQGGHLSGREERRDEFQGEPKTVGSTLGGRGADGTTSLTHPEGHSSSTHSGSHNPLSSNSNTTHSGVRDGGINSSSTHSGIRDGGVNSSRDTGLAGSTSTGHNGSYGTSNGGTHGTTGGHSVTGNETEHKKPGLLAKLNPMVDSNGDGKAGFMK